MKYRIEVGAVLEVEIDAASLAEAESQARRIVVGTDDAEVITSRVDRVAQAPRRDLSRMVGALVEFRDGYAHPISNYEIDLSRKRGRVAYFDGGIFAVTLDERIEDLDEWQNEVQFSVSDGDEPLDAINEVDEVSGAPTV